LKLATALLLFASLLLALAACTQTADPDTPAATPPPEALASLTATATQTPPATPAPTQAVATETPEPTATAIPTPTATPLPPTPTPTPEPTSTPTPTPTPTPAPTATPQPTPTPTPVPAGTAQLDLGGGILMTVTPEIAFSGRDVSFGLSGLTPWRKVTITISGPDGVPSPWITDDDVNLVDSSGVKSTSATLYPTESGQLEWKRYGINDEAGTWTVDLDLDGSAAGIEYTMNELQLGGEEPITIGVQMTRHTGSGPTTYYSSSVPLALMVDLQQQLNTTALLMEDRTGATVAQLPDLYLMANREIMEQVASATGVDLGFEDGYYKGFGARPGIYMRTDFLTTEAERLLTHEYVHMVSDELANGRDLAAWLTEGLSRYYEYDVSLSGSRADATKLRVYRAADAARDAAQAGGLFSLNTLDDQSDWNARTDQNEISLQYNQSYMAIRFLNETYGPLSGVSVVEDIGRGLTLSQAIESVTGLTLAVFETQFVRWLEGWEDSSRLTVSDYLSGLDLLLADKDALLQQRSQDISVPMTAGESSISRLALVRSAEDLVTGLQHISPPEDALDLHQEAAEYFNLIVEWLNLEFQHAETRDDTYRVRANQMIPEVDAREALLQRGVSNRKFVLNLGD